MKTFRAVLIEMKDSTPQVTFLEGYDVSQIVEFQSADDPRALFAALDQVRDLRYHVWASETGDATATHFASFTLRTDADWFANMLRKSNPSWLVEVRQ